VKLLLASGSATRRRMLEDAGVPCDVVRPELDEDALKRDLLGRVTGPELAQALADAKALSVAAPGDALVLGSDQVLEQEDGAILSKAGSPDEAAEQLLSLAGKSHRLHSAASLAEAGTMVWRGGETVTLRMRSLSAPFLRDYLAQEWNQVRHNVGAYRIEGPGVQLFEQIEGSHFAILGMPLLPLLGALRRRGVLAS
jgi:septum formation protein